MISHQRPPSSPRGFQLSRSAVSASGGGIAGGNKGIPEDSPVRCCRPPWLLQTKVSQFDGSRCLRRIHAGKPRAGNRYDGPVHTPHYHHRHRFATERSSNRLTFGILDTSVGRVLSSQEGKNPTAQTHLPLLVSCEPARYSTSH